MVILLPLAVVLTFRLVREEELDFFPTLAGSSPDKKFPQAEFSPYQNNKFEWNPTVCFLHLAVGIHDMFAFNIFTLQSGIFCIMHCKLYTYHITLEYFIYHFTLYILILYFCFPCITTKNYSTCVCRDLVLCGGFMIFLYFCFLKAAHNPFRR